jgi:ElaB/YqjD/DUF883 family membrane-anchored ribosome-binding protein
MATTRHRTSTRSRQGTTDAQALLNGALSMASSVADYQKESLASTIHQAAEATYEYGQSLDNLPYMRDYVEEAAHLLDNVGDYVEQADVRNLWHDVGSFARRRPAATLGVAVLTGLIAGQLLQSMSIRQQNGSRPTVRSRGRSARRHG